MSLTVIRLEADNYKGLRAIDITPEPGEPLVVLAGDTAQGKTSALDSVWAALSGATAARDSGQQIHDGEERARVRLDLGDIVVERRWKRGGKPAGELTVTSARGANFTSPQAALDKLLGPLALQPEKFLELDRATQVRTLVETLGTALPFDPKGIQADRDTATVRRRDANRDAKAQAAVVAQYGEIEKPAAGEDEISASDVLDEIRAAQSLETRARDTAGQIQTQKHIIAREEEILVELQRQIVEHDQERTAALERVAALEEAASEIVVPDIEPLREKLADVEQTNAEIRRWRDYQRAQDRLDNLQADAAEHDAELVRLAEVERAGLAAASEAMPLEGLSFTADDGVIYNGHPLKDISGREALFVCTAIAMQMIPTDGIRVIRIDRGESLDRKDMAQLAKLADEKNVQVWISRVGDAAEGEWTITEGTATR
jgi:hypothetical protein